MGLRLIRTPAATCVSADAICGDVVGPCPEPGCKGSLVLMIQAPKVAGCCCDGCGFDARLPWEGGRAPSDELLRESAQELLEPGPIPTEIDAYWVAAFRDHAGDIGLQRSDIDRMLRKAPTQMPDDWQDEPEPPPRWRKPKSEVRRAKRGQSQRERLGMSAEQWAAFGESAQ